MVFPASWRRLFSALVVTAASKTKMMLLLFSVLYSVWTANYTASNGDVIRELSAQFLELAEKQEATAPLLNRDFIRLGFLGVARIRCPSVRRNSLGRFGRAFREHSEAQPSHRTIANLPKSVTYTTSEIRSLAVQYPRPSRPKFVTCCRQPVTARTVASGSKQSKNMPFSEFWKLLGGRSVKLPQASQMATLTLEIEATLRNVG